MADYTYHANLCDVKRLIRKAAEMIKFPKRFNNIEAYKLSKLWKLDFPGKEENLPNSKSLQNENFI